VQIRRLTRWLSVAATAAALLVGSATIAFAQAYPGGGETPPEVGGEQFFPGGPIPKTGSDVLMFVMIALVAVVAGIALRRVTRRAAHSDE
jgi:hypothetical protein